MISLSLTARTLQAMSSVRQKTPVVPLEAGAGPDNPPCPACGEPLFGWIDQRAGIAGPVSRCESCGLGVVAEPGSVEDALHDLDRVSDGETIRIANRAGFAAWIGGAGWPGLEPGARYLYTAESVRRLIANRDQVVTSNPLGARRRGSRRCGRRCSTASPSAATWRWERSAAPSRCRRAALAAAHGRRISVVVAIPALLFAVPMELIAAALRRGGALTLRIELL